MSFAELSQLRDQLVREPLPNDRDMIVAVRLSSAMRYYLGLTSDGMICALIQTDLEFLGR